MVFKCKFYTACGKELKMLMEGIPKYSPVFLPLYIYVMASAKVGEKLSRNQ